MGRRRKRLLTVEIIVWDEGSTVHFKPGVPPGRLYERADALGAKYIATLRAAVLSKTKAGR